VLSQPLATAPRVLTHHTNPGSTCRQQLSASEHAGERIYILFEHPACYLISSASSHSRSALPSPAATAVAVSFQEVSSEIARCGCSVANEARAASTRSCAQDSRSAVDKASIQGKIFVMRSVSVPFSSMATVINCAANSRRRAPLSLALRHQHQSLAVATRDRDRMVFGRGEALGGVLAQIRGATCPVGAISCNRHNHIPFGTYSEV